MGYWFLKEKVKIVKNGIEIVSENIEIKQPEKTIILGNSARFDFQKDQKTILVALKLLKNSGIKFKFLIAGEGEERNKIESIIRELYLEHDVVLLGRRDDIPELMVKADIFVLPSAYEGFGLVVAEAMSCERVVIGTDCGGVKEVIGSEGFLVEPENHIALADAMQKAIDLDYDQRKLMGHKARQRIIKNYSLNAAVSKWLELYKDPKRV